MATNETPEGGVAPVEASLDEELVEGSDLDPLLAFLEDELPVGLDDGGRTRRLDGPAFLLDPGGHGGRVGES